jgi:hypothetical protein
MNRLFFLVVLCALLQTTSTTAQSTQRDFKQLLQLFEGNFRCVEWPDTAIEKRMIEPVNILIKRVPGTFMGPNTFYVKYTKPNGALSRHRLYTFTFDGQKIVSINLGFVNDTLHVDLYKYPEKIKALTRADTRMVMDCPDIWNKTNDGFVGYMDFCPFYSKRRGEEIYIAGRSLISASGMSTTEIGKDKKGIVIFGKDDYTLRLVRE